MMCGTKGEGGCRAVANMYAAREKKNFLLSWVELGKGRGIGSVGKSIVAIRGE